MPDSKKNSVTPPAPRGTTAAACKTALAGTYKALKAYSFYPESHPLRERILHGSFQALAHAAKDDMLSFVVNRNGFTFADGRTPVESTPMTKALAQGAFRQGNPAGSWCSPPFPSPTSPDSLRSCRWTLPRSSPAA